MITIREGLPPAALCALLCTTGWGIIAVARAGPDGRATRWTTRNASPIDVQLSIPADSCAIGENFIITCTFTNITREPVRLHATDLDLLVDPLWVSIDDGPVKQGHRIGMHSGKERPASEDLIEFDAGESLETKVFFLQGETLPLFLVDPTALSLRADVGPITVYGDSNKIWTVTTNTIEIAVRAPDREDITAFNELDWVLKGRAKRGTKTYLAELEEWLGDHSDSPLAPRVHYELVQAWSGRLDALNREELHPSKVLFASLRFCLEKGAPYSSIVGRDYLEFLYVQKRWELIELAALCIQDRAKVSRLSDGAESYVGTWGALLDTRAFAGLDDSWKDRLRAPLLQCLRRSLESGNPYAMRLAPRLLAQLEEAKAWTVLGKVARWTETACSPAVDAERYLKVARERGGNGAASNVSTKP